MALTEGWYIDGKALEDLGRVIEIRDGWADTPQVRGENTVLAGPHGESWRRKTFGPGQKTITMAIHGSLDDSFTIPAEGSDQRAAYESNLDDLIRLLTPR